MKTQNILLIALLVLLTGLTTCKKDHDIPTGKVFNSESGLDSLIISVSANPNDGGQVYGGGTYQKGQECTVIASPNEGYAFANWKENDSIVAEGKLFRFTVTSNRTLVANFVQQEPQNYTISVSANPSDGGTINGSGTYQSGQTCMVTASANEGYIFTNWTENGTQVSTSTAYSFTVNADRALVANFSVSTGSYTITAVSSPIYGGVINGAGTYTQGQTCTLTAISHEGYTFTNWTENGTQVSDEVRYSFTVTSNRTLVAHFTANPQNYDINVSADPSNGGTVSGGGTYQQGQSCTVIATANTGYTFTNWTENGSVVSNSASYTFTVNGNRNLVAQFQQQSYTISISANPSSGGSVSGGGTYNYGQSCTVHATANSNYTFSNWTENSNVVSTNANYTFTVNSNRTLVANFNYNGGGTHEYVDLGLPSGLLWATCNIGADSPEDYGDYFAWGETQPKSTYDWSTYQYCMGNMNTLTKYCNHASYGYNGFTDDLTVLEACDDVATARWGSGWRMPTAEEWEELYNNTAVTWTQQNGVNGRLFTATNGNSLFLPAAGFRGESSLYCAGSNGLYWSSSLSTLYTSSAWYFGFGSGNYSMSMNYTNRCDGRSVRAVRTTREN